MKLAGENRKITLTPWATFIKVYCITLPAVYPHHPPYAPVAMRYGLYLYNLRDWEE